jgi:serine protease Do
VILQIDKKPIVAPGELPALAAMTPPGQKIEIKVWRNGAALLLSATLGDSSPVTREPAPSARAVPVSGQLGLVLRPLEAGEQIIFGLAAGLVVESASGPSQDAGVHPGDVILAVNGRPASSVEKFRDAVAGAEKAVALLIQREGEKSFLPIRVP